MIEFIEGEWFSVAGRGNVFSTKMPLDYRGNLLNEEILISGHQYTVTGVEMFSVFSPHEITFFKGRSVGLLVRGLRKDI